MGTIVFSIFSKLKTASVWQHFNHLLVFLIFRGEKSDVATKTLSRGLSAGAGKGNHAFVHLDAHHYVLVLHQLGEGLAIISLLVERLMEEDDAADAGVDLFVSSKEELAVKPPVLLCVLSIDALKALGHAA